MSNHETSKLDKRYAYIYRRGGSPIYSAGQMIPDKPLECRPLDKERQRIINSSEWWASGYKGKDRGTPEDMILVQKLLTIGGYEACVQYHEEDAAHLLERGQLWYGDRVDLKKGRPSQCHANTCELWEANHKQFEVAIATGYALSKDGMWRQHSWLLWRKTRSVRIIETTTRRIAYFGFVMTEGQAQKFCYLNY